MRSFKNVILKKTLSYIFSNLAKVKVTDKIIITPEDFNGLLLDFEKIPNLPPLFCCYGNGDVNKTCSKLSSSLDTLIDIVPFS